MSQKHTHALHNENFVVLLHIVDQALFKVLKAYAAFNPDVGMFPLSSRSVPPGREMV